MYDASERLLDETGYESPFADLARLDTTTRDETFPAWELEEQSSWDGELQVSTPTATGIAAGRQVVDRHPLLTAHRGTPPDLVLRWNAMPNTVATVDVVVHLHGYSGRGQRLRVTDKEPISGLDLNLPDGTAGRARPTLTLLPRGNYFGGRSGAAYNFPALTPRGALLRLVDDGLARFRTLTGSSAQRGRLVLTAHSGGGAPLNAILRHTDIDEVQVFDGLYGDASSLVAWAKKKITSGAPNSAMAVLYVPGTGTAKQSQRVGRELCGLISRQAQAAALRPRFRVEATRVPHNDIPKTFGWRLLADPAGGLPGTNLAGELVGHRSDRQPRRRRTDRRGSRRHPRAHPRRRRRLGSRLLPEDPQATNTVIVWDGTDGPGERHDKKIVQPFGEYLPWRSFFRLLSSFADRAGYFVPGDGNGVVHAAGIPIGVTTCWEVIFDRAAREAVLSGAQFIAVPTNNATFDESMSAQQLAFARLRAVEHDRYVVVAGTTGISAVIGPDGREMARTAFFEPAYLDAQIRLKTSLTPATRWGPVIQGLIMIVGVAAVAWRCCTMERSQRSSRGAAKRWRIAKKPTRE